MLDLFFRRKKTLVVRERLLKKYKGIRFFDAEEDETYVIVDVEYKKTIHALHNMQLSAYCTALQARRLRNMTPSPT